MTHDLHGKNNSSQSGFLSMNCGGQEEMAQNISSAERKNCQLRILYSMKISCRNEGKEKTSSDKGNSENLSPADLL